MGSTTTTFITYLINNGCTKRTEDLAAARYICYDKNLDKEKFFINLIEMDYGRNEKQIFPSLTKGADCIIGVEGVYKKHFMRGEERNMFFYNKALVYSKKDANKENKQEKEETKEKEEDGIQVKIVEKNIIKGIIGNKNNYFFNYNRKNGVNQDKTMFTVDLNWRRHKDIGSYNNKKSLHHYVNNMSFDMSREVTVLNVELLKERLPAECKNSEVDSEVMRFIALLNAMNRGIVPTETFWDKCSTKLVNINMEFKFYHNKIETITLISPLLNKYLLKKNENKINPWYFRWTENPTVDVSFGTRILEDRLPTVYPYTFLSFFRKIGSKSEFKIVISKCNGAVSPNENTLQVHAGLKETKM
eukprot:GHVR01185903.1.p1 GENE.GHVR01185903.1~~GHVR01185903.1.p1  ORF type:complete len:408 (-),score=60.17 GHVR01185903.1:473-1549(-)